MYKSPVSIMETAVRKIVEERDNEIFYKIQSALGVDVDRGELMRALQYDRNQYEKGYADGKADAMAEIVRCKDCKHQHDPMVCPMCFEEQIEWDDDGYSEIDWIVHDRTIDDGFCDRGERRTDA